MPKSSQAARNSCLSVARRSASRRRQAGSTLKKLNLAKVRSAGMALTIALCLFLVAAPGASAASAPPDQPAVDLLWLPPSTTVSQLAEYGFSPGLMSAGLGSVPAEQTYLDIGAGNRTFDSLYDPALPPSASGGCDNRWSEEVQERAESAPDEIEPFLLTRLLVEAGIQGTGTAPSACPLGLVPTVFSGANPEKKNFSTSNAVLPRARRLASHGGPNV